MSWTMPSGHPCLAGHFPGRPLAPGVTVLDAAFQAIAAAEAGVTAIGMNLCACAAIDMTQRAVMPAAMRHIGLATARRPALASRPFAGVITAGTRAFACPVATAGVPADQRTGQRQVLELVQVVDVVRRRQPTLTGPAQRVVHPTHPAPRPSAQRYSNASPTG